MSVLESQEIAEAVKNSPREPEASKIQAATEKTPPPLPPQADALAGARTELKEHLSHSEKNSVQPVEGVTNTQVQNVSLSNRIQYTVAEAGVRFLTSRLFVPDYTDGKGGDDHAEVSPTHRLTPKHTGGPSNISSTTHTLALLKIPLQVLKRKLGY